MKTRWILSCCAVAAVAAAALFFRPWNRLSARTTDAQSNAAPGDQPARDTEEKRTTVLLPPEKAAVARIETKPAERRPLGRTITVPGRIQYDDTRHIQVRAATAGVLVDVLVKPGDAVVTGQVLAILSSPEVGTARADVLQKDGEVQVLAEEFAWREKTGAGITTLGEAIGRRDALDAIRTSFRDVPLGKGGEAVLTAYARLRLADSLAQGLSGAQDSGALSQRMVRERLSEVESADAALKGAMEQAAFDSRQMFRQSQVGLEAARRRLEVSRQHLNTLLGYTEQMSAKSAPADLSHVEVRAPFAGTIEQKLVSTAERTQLGETLFILADTASLWVAADLRERDWSALRLREGDPLTIESPALPGKSLPAKVHFLGREVSELTNSVPLVGAIDNRDGTLRPGLFVRVTIPVEAPRDVVAIPESAVTRHDGAPFVFIAQGTSEYREVPVTTGLEHGGWVEVVEGLRSGEPVVTAGTFFLKSELLLEAE